jgi:hypothetical protein
MVVQWLTFAVMILIQAVAASAIMASIRTTLKEHAHEIDRLREWRHKFGPKEMVYDDHGFKLADHETRIRVVERQAHDDRIRLRAIEQGTPEEQ